jgi:N-acetylmuramoyl-L-alanine amidase
LEARFVKIPFIIKLFLFFVLSAAMILGACYFFGGFGGQGLQSSSADAKTESKYKTVITDAGHGGEDGGASSTSGLIEKNLNLEIASLLSEILTKHGVKVVMTRTDDRLLYDRNVDFEGRKKKLDLAARLEVAKTYEESVFVSIHMNSFSDKRYSGLQVWYSQNCPESMVLAQKIQSNARSKLQPSNKRSIKAADSKIFLLDNAISPAVLVECGFLSNPEEARLFESEEYKREIARVLFESIMEFLNDQG